jgi:paraquat-inducible protein B
MSKPISPTAIGGFTLGALVLLVAGLLIFGGGEAFNADKVRFVVFLESSLNGLDVGAPVKMQGVKIGEVKQIALQFDDKRDKLFKPVVLEIDRRLLSGSGSSPLPDAMSDEELKANRDRLVASGFRARLEMQSLLTGLLYVDLDVHPDKPPVFANLEYQGLLEIPGIPATTEELRNTAEEVAKKLRALPLDQIVQDLADSLREIKTLLASDDIKKSKMALANTLEEVEKTIKILNQNLEPLLNDTSKTMASTGALIEDSRAMVKELHSEMRPLLSNTDKTLTAATAALKRADESLQKIGDAVGPESALPDTLQALKDAARAIRDLGDYLERHPESLLSGKNQ